MKKSFYLFVFLFISITCATAQRTRWNAQYQAYIDEYRELAIEQMLKYHIPASITLAQGLLESGAGKSSLAKYGNNHFGIKCHNWDGKTMHKDDDLSNECFRVYDNAYQSYEDHSKFLTRYKRYSSLFTLKITDYKGWAHGLKAAGYATSPIYAQSLINLIETYDLNQYDKAKHYDHFIVSKSGYDTSTSSDLSLHPIYKYNKNYYLKARNGDTFESIGREVGIKGKKLAKYNERSYKDKLSEGEIIYLKKKRKRADKAFKKFLHIARPGESLYHISQQYGIRLKYLYRINDFPADYQLRVGDAIRVY